MLYKSVNSVSYFKNGGNYIIF